MEILNISHLDTYTVRHPVLRTGRPIEDCAFEGDENDKTQHLGAFKNNELIGVLTLMETQRKVQNRPSWQLRGMAVLEAHQKTGVGRKLINRAEEIAKSQQIQALWLNARKIAVPFYQNMGYHIDGSPFNIPKIGIHYWMYKLLQ